MKDKTIVSVTSKDQAKDVNAHYPDVLLQLYRNFTRMISDDFIEDTLEVLYSELHFSGIFLLKFVQGTSVIKCQLCLPNNPKFEGQRKTIDLTNLIKAIPKSDYLLVQSDDNSGYSNLRKTGFFKKQESLVVFGIGENKLDGLLVFVSNEKIEQSKLPVTLLKEYTNLITQRLKSKEAQLTEPIFEKLTETLVEGVAIVEKGFIRYVNKKFMSMFGYQTEDILGKSILNLVAKKDQDFVKGMLKRAGEETYEVTCKKFNDQEFPVEACGRTLRYKNRELRLCVLRDTSHDRNIANFLKDREAQYHNLFTFTNDAIFIIDPGTYQILDTNEKAHELLGYNRQEYNQLHFFELEERPDKQKISSMIQKMITKENIIYEHKFVRKDGVAIIVEINARLVEQSAQKIILCFVRDITARKKMESVLGRAQRLEAAGKVAGQIAHDFNNLLGPLAAYPSIIQSELPPDHPAQEMLTEMEFSANKIAEINQQLLTLGRRGHYRKEHINLNDILHKVILQYPQENFTLKQEMDKELFLIEGGAAQIMRILMNLIQNSIEAISHGGKIGIKTENIHIEKPASQKRLKKGDYVKISISDTGHGIPPKILEKIFDPFFTTKRMDKQRGTGLGLSIVHSIMDDHKGHITVESTVNVGTTFTLLFPVSKKLNVDSVIPHLKGGHEKILIVDDDPLQRNVSAELLRRLGYKTTCVDSGIKAIKFIKKSPQDIILMDMLMAGLNGAETYRRILELYPNQKAIIITGYSMTQQIRDAMELGAGAYLSKPVTLLALGTAIRKELDRKPKQLILN